MRTIARIFNTAGPIKPEIHYHVDPLTRFNLEEIESLIEYGKYFILHAPRQTGKTSCLLALRDYLNRQGRYYAVSANVESGQAFRNRVEEVIPMVVSKICRQLGA
ncbi:MAG: AAA-like domain-containing protein, partial [Prevotellaceae bacterium]|nr:AAA-like domain-containing protein [Prevotellaceae bacterium]